MRDNLSKRSGIFESRGEKFTEAKNAKKMVSYSKDKRFLPSIGGS